MASPASIARRRNEGVGPPVGPDYGGHDLAAAGLVNGQEQDALGVGTEFTQAYLARFLEQKTLSAKDLTEFYFAAEGHAAWKVEEAAIKADLEAWTATLEG